MLVYRHIAGQFDVFSGEGFYTRTLVKRVKHPEGVTFKYVSGQRLPSAVLHILADKVNPSLHRQTIEE